MAPDLEDVTRERRFLAAHPEWNIFSAGHGARWTAERDEDGEIVIAVRFTLRELLDRLEEIDPPDATTTTASKPTGWRLTQPEPGVLVWHAPAGRSYTTTPTQYAI